ncbi:hypothetical protein ACMBCM_00735 [Spiroplasma sp. K1]
MNKIKKIKSNNQDITQNNEPLKNDFLKAPCKWNATNQLRKRLIFYWKETLFYFVVLSNSKYGKDNRLLA